MDDAPAPAHDVPLSDHDLDAVASLVRDMGGLGSEPEQEPVKQKRSKRRKKKPSSPGNEAIRIEPEPAPYRHECIVCMDAEAACALIPCGHQHFCATCANDYVGKPCPTCRALATALLRVFQ